MGKILNVLCLLCDTFIHTNLLYTTVKICGGVSMKESHLNFNSKMAQLVEHLNVVYTAPLIEHLNVAYTAQLVEHYSIQVQHLSIVYTAQLVEHLRRFGRL